MGVEWVSGAVPASRRCVLVQVHAVPSGSGRPDSGMPATIAVGYWKDKGSDGAYWVIPGVGTRGGVAAWSDCLGDDFRAPLWPGTSEGGPLATALADRDAHVRGYEDLEQRHAAVVAERDQALQERDEARFAQQAEHVRFVLLEGIGIACEKMRAERDGMRRERDVRADLYTAAADECHELRIERAHRLAERDALKAEVERLRNENQTAWNKASFLDEGLRHLRAAIEPTAANVEDLAAALRGSQYIYGEMTEADREGIARAVLAAIAARAGKP